MEKNFIIKTKIEIGIKPSYEIMNDAIAIYRSKASALGTLIGAGFVFLLLLTVTLLNNIKIDLPILGILSFVFILVVLGLVSLYNDTPKMVVSKELIRYKDRFYVWNNIKKINWNQTYDGYGTHNLNVLIWLDESLNKPIEMRIDVSRSGFRSFTDKVFEPYICDILKLYPEIEVGDNTCLCNDYLGIHDLKN